MLFIGTVYIFFRSIAIYYVVCFPSQVKNSQTMELTCRCSILLIFFTVGVMAQFEDIAGDYCGGRTQHCCDGRIDSCAIPILGTLCYCDQFCNRTTSSDCCPDYWNVCLGIQPPEPLTQQHGTKSFIPLLLSLLNVQSTLVDFSIRMLS